MESMSSLQMQQERACLRAKYNEAASGLLKTLQSEPKTAYQRDDLAKLRVALKSFDPESQAFLDSKSCLFEPLPPKDREKYYLNKSRLAIGDCSVLEFEEPPESVEEGASSPRRTASMKRRAAGEIFEYLNTICRKSERKNPRASLEELSGWITIKDGDSFDDGAMGLFYGLGRNVPFWYVETLRQWQDDWDDPKKISPHIMLVISSGTSVNDGELLFTELGPLTQAIQNRLRRKEFEKTSLFPVLAVSLFGPRHGRILQAKFDKSGILTIRASSIRSFLRKKEAPFDLCLRYLVSEPRDGPEYEFHSDKVDEPTLAPEV